MEHYPKYGETGFYVEYWYLRENPKTISDVCRQLKCLAELEENGINAYKPFKQPSKRRTRLLRQYWAMYLIEKRAIT